MDLKELYQEIILDHGKNPRNLGKFENFLSSFNQKAIFKVNLRNSQNFIKNKV